MNVLCAILLLAELTLGSWNLRWFPSGRAEHRSSPRVEAANCDDAAEVIRAGLGKNRCVLFLQELRDYNAASNLAARIGRDGLRPVAVSSFRVRDRRLDWQQCVIFSDLPVVTAGWQKWREPTDGNARPPRGYAYAVLDDGTNGLIACWCVHLKSNYGATTDERRREDISKRETSARELLELAKSVRAPNGRKIRRQVIAGDFNTDPFEGRFAEERTVSLLVDGGFVNPFEGLPLHLRGTHPGNTRYRDSTLDFVLTRGFVSRGIPHLSPAVPLSDHRMVWMEVR